MPRVTKITSAAPLTIDRGTGEFSSRVVPLEKTPLPQHLAKLYMQTSRGRLGPQVVTSAERLYVFGKESFDELGDFTNHQTILSNRIGQEGNTQIIERLTNATHANLTLWLDVAEDASLTEFDRDADGKIVYDTFGVPVDAGTTTAGFRARWVLTSETGLAPNETKYGQQWASFGTKTPKPGSLTGGSTMYPMYDFVAEEPGEKGLDFGLKLWADLEGLDEEEYAEQSAFPYGLAMIARRTRTSTPKHMETILGSREIKVTMSPNAIDELSGRATDIATSIAEQYNNTVDTQYPKVLGTVEHFIHTYDENIASLHDQFMTRELEYLELNSISHDYPFTSTEYDTGRGHQYAFNIVDGRNIQGVPAYTFQIDPSAAVVDGVSLTSQTNLMFNGAEDNVMTVDEMEAKLLEKVAKYADPEDFVQDRARHPEQVFYDSGFTVATKLGMCDVVALRKDVILVTCTHVDSIEVRGARKAAPIGSPLPVGTDKPLTMEEEVQTSIAITSRASMYPESDYFGTPVMRVVIMGGSGLIRNSRWRHRTGTHYHLAAKAAAYMGSSNGNWKPGNEFSSAPGNIVEDLYDINIDWVSPSKRLRVYDVNLNVPLNYDDTRVHFPGIQTAYHDDTSVLNNFPTVMCICTVSKATAATWRELTGTDDLNDAQFIARVNSELRSRVTGRFANIYSIQPKAYMSEADKLRGYSWKLPVEVHANMSRTVEETWVEAYRFDQTTGEQ